MNINCKDVYNFASNYDPDVSKTLSGLSDSPLCSTKEGLNQMCSLLSIFEPKLETMGLTVNDIIPACNQFMTDCHDTLCSKGQLDSTLKLSCKDVDYIVKLALSNSNVQDEIKKTTGQTINNTDDLCKLISIIFDNDPEKLKAFIQQQSTGQPTEFTKYIDQVPSIVQCICPSFNPPPSPKSRSKNSRLYNPIAIGITIAILIILLFVPFIFILVTKKLNALSKISLVGILLILTLLSLTLLIYFNPKCIYKTCPVSGDDWTPISGTYTGNKSILSTNISLSMTFDNTNTIKINSLTCDGNQCPVNDLLSKCDSKIAMIDSVKTPSGYIIYGDCIDKMKNIQTGDGSPIIQGLWAVRKDNNIYIQILLHICVNQTTCLPYSLLVPLNAA